MKSPLLIFLMLLLLASARGQHLYWNMDGNLAANVPDRPLHLSNARVNTDYVEGVKGQALRTDGYSNWLSTAIPVANHHHANAWFALESWPCDTSAFFVLHSADSSSAMSVLINKFGQLFIGVKRPKLGTIKYAAGDVTLFSWLQISFEVTRDSLKLLVNDVLKVVVPSPPDLDISGINRMLIGRALEQKRVACYNSNAINGIVDEVMLAQSPENRPYTVNPTTAPDLAPPPTRFATDVHRPKFHLIPAANWTNESHGLLFHNGRFHLFNQKNASNLFLSQINWGHFSSRDLLQWIEHRPVLQPEPRYDPMGIWSGHAVHTETGDAMIVYTAGDTAGTHIALAFSSDSLLLHWKKYQGNPVVVHAPVGYNGAYFRDPFIFSVKNRWYMTVGCGSFLDSKEVGDLLLYRSDDLLNWEFLHSLYKGKGENDNSGIFWEMPLFVQMEDKFVLLVNKVPQPGKPAVALYWTGDFINERFVPDHAKPKKLEVVNRLLSPSIAKDNYGQTVAIGIIPDEIPCEAAKRHGWTHLFSTPRIWTLKDGFINQQPHPVLQTLRRDSVAIHQRRISEGKSLLLSQTGHQLELMANLVADSNSYFGIRIQPNKDASEYCELYFDHSRQQFVVNLHYENSGLPDNLREEHFTLQVSDTINFHLYIDGSVIELFVNNKYALTSRFFPADKSALQVELFCKKAGMQVLNAKTWALSSSGNMVDFSR